MANPQIINEFIRNGVFVLNNINVELSRPRVGNFDTTYTGTVTYQKWFSSYVIHKYIVIYIRQSLQTIRAIKIVKIRCKLNDCSIPVQRERQPLTPPDLYMKYDLEKLLGMRIHATLSFTMDIVLYPFDVLMFGKSF